MYTHHLGVMFLGNNTSFYKERQPSRLGLQPRRASRVQGQGTMMWVIMRVGSHYAHRSLLMHRSNGRPSFFSLLTYFFHAECLSSRDILLQVTFTRCCVSFQFMAGSNHLHVESDNNNPNICSQWTFPVM